MGEVLVRARLTNASDEELVRRGTLAADQIRTYETAALVDTGAARAVIPAHVMARLGLTIRTRQLIEFADGRRELVSITGPVLVELEGRSTVDEALVLGDQVLIGQTVLEKLDLFVDCRGQQVIPNPRHPDEPIARV